MNMNKSVPEKINQKTKNRDYLNNVNLGLSQGNYNVMLLFNNFFSKSKLDKI